ncbi:GNAT family N-acetyltransferase [Loktanella sp. S4079]|uniref:GNAT family N-acetyltransferase n=1 Tax=Loktanella sp. S4079 TaxID=579483 RepID=UPI0005F9CB93|nr:GNAT family N-acetyltransferase [Loktanella sp. S4079]KJZ20267.1 ornithine-acyl-ACP acyltransferase [Loktanella sp. S4079]
MTFPFQKGRLTARLAKQADELRLCQEMRHARFFGKVGRDVDAYDARFEHLMIEDENGQLCATLRFRIAVDGAALGHGYVGQFYDLAPIARRTGPFLEIGRFCTRSDPADADLLRMLWGALTRIVDAHDVTMLIGCTSFTGTDPRRYGTVFQRLAQMHQGPTHLSPQITATHAVPLADIPADGIAPMPSLLRSYLTMGGWVGDHVVVDHAMNTLHMFTCVEVAAMSAARVARLRAVAS